MGKIRKKTRSSLKWKLFWYIPICAILAYAGTYGIGIGTNYIQDWYMEEYLGIDFEPHEERYEIMTDENGVTYYHFYEEELFEAENQERRVGYWLISWAQVLLIPIWVLSCVAVTGTIFYKRELEASITILMEASKKIEENCLDFHVEAGNSNELGQLCRSFENMREVLYRQNQKMWRMLEERKRLNAAFSHDMRTPITVLKGYTDLLTQHISDGKISEEKLLKILGMMNGQITRLESYTQKMGALQKLEDIIPELATVSWKEFENKCKNIAEVFKDEKQIQFKGSADREEFMLDEELVLEVYENLLSNALRYARSKIVIDIFVQKEKFYLSVEDDGKGFDKETLRNATKPFYREEAEKDKKHFGLGLYICKTICEKCGGNIMIENASLGGRVTASFQINLEK